MKNYRAEDLEVGLILAEEINLFDGLIVIKSGVELDEPIIEILKKQQLSSILIQEPIDQNKYCSEEEIKQLKKAIEKQKKEIFRDCHDDDYMKALFKVVCDLRLLESMDG